MSDRPNNWNNFLQGESRSQAKRLAAQGKLPETSLELAEQLHKMWCLHSGTGHEIYLEKGAALIDAYILEREAEAIKEAARAFENEYCDHDSPMIGTIRGLAAIRALATARASQCSPREKP